MCSKNICNRNKNVDETVKNVLVGDDPIPHRFPENTSILLHDLMFTLYIVNSRLRHFGDFSLDT